MVQTVRCLSKIEHTSTAVSRYLGGRKISRPEPHLTSMVSAVEDGRLLYSSTERMTSPGGRLPGKDLAPEDQERYGTEDLEAGTVVVVEAEGKETACMVGVLKVGTAEMKKTKKGQACEAGHYLGDGLWTLAL